MTTLGVTTFPALGTNATVVATDLRSLDRAEGAVRAEIDAIDHACSRFREDSELSALHESARDRWTLVSPVLFEAIEIALGAASATDGAVDPTIGEALRSAGYDRDFRLVAPSTDPVEHRPAPGWSVVRMDADRCAVLLPAGVRIDLGATAKALAVDRACVRAVESAGCGVLVSIGGDIAAFGEPPPGQAIPARPSRSRAAASRRPAPPFGGGCEEASPSTT